MRSLASLRRICPTFANDGPFTQQWMEISAPAIAVRTLTLGLACSTGILKDLGKGAFWLTAMQTPIGWIGFRV